MIFNMSKYFCEDLNTTIINGPYTPVFTTGTNVNDLVLLVKNLAKLRKDAFSVAVFSNHPNFELLSRVVSSSFSENIRISIIKNIEQFVLCKEKTFDLIVLDQSLAQVNFTKEIFQSHHLTSKLLVIQCNGIIDYDYGATVNFDPDFISTSQLDVYDLLKFIALSYSSDSHLQGVS